MSTLKIIYCLAGYLCITQNNKYRKTFSWTKNVTIAHNNKLIKFPIDFRIITTKIMTLKVKQK